MVRTPLSPFALACIAIWISVLGTACGDDATDNDPGAGGHDGGDGTPGCVGCEPCVNSDAPTPLEQTLLDLSPHSWFELPDSQMRDVCAPSDTVYFGDCRNVVGAWSSGAYDSVQRRMILWGGGHADYSGNELYAFDLRTGTWSRVTEPSRVPAGTDVADFFSQDPLPDGEPVGRHSYDGVEFVPDLGILWAHAGSMAGGSGNSTKLTWVFDANNGWSQRAEGPGGYALATAYDRANQQMMVHTAESLHIYDVDGDTWTAVPGFGYPPLWPRYTFNLDKTGVIDSRRGLFWVVGGHGKRSPDEPPIGGHGNVMVWDIAAGEAVTDAWITAGGGEFTNADFVSQNHPDQLFESGGGDIYNVMAPGIEYDPTTDSLVAWPNVGAPYILDLETKVWTMGSADGAPPNTTASNSGGTFGRWRYLEAYNVFILVNSIDENVYFYKHSAGCGPE